MAGGGSVAGAMSLALAMPLADANCAGASGGTTSTAIAGIGATAGVEVEGDCSSALQWRAHSAPGSGAPGAISRLSDVLAKAFV